MIDSLATDGQAPSEARALGSTAPTVLVLVHGVGLGQPDEARESVSQMLKALSVDAVETYEFYWHTLAGKPVHVSTSLDFLARTMEGLRHISAPVREELKTGAVADLVSVVHETALRLLGAATELATALLLVVPLLFMIAGLHKWPDSIRAAFPFWCNSVLALAALSFVSGLSLREDAEEGIRRQWPPVGPSLASCDP